MRHYLSVDDLSTTELPDLLDLAGALKADRGAHAQALAGRSIALIFEKPSTRTRVSFEVGVEQLGAHAVVLSAAELQLGRGETIQDTGRVLSRYVDAIVLRTFEQERLEILSTTATVPVVNALSDFEHPCQALADLLTIREHHRRPPRPRPHLPRRRQQRRALAAAGRHEGGDARACRHAARASSRSRRWCIAPRRSPRRRVASVELTHDPEGAAVGAHVLSTDVWTSMGQDLEADERALVFPSYQLSQKLVDLADPEVIVLHCLPAHRGQEITDEVIDGPRSVVWDQAENRLHTQKALLLRLFGVA